VEVQEKPKGEEGEKETVVAKDGSRWTKGDMWCENNANHSTKGRTAAARKNQRKEWGQSQANVASLEPFDDIDSDRDEVFPLTLAVQPTIRRGGAFNVVVEPEATTSIPPSALLADRDNKLVLDSGATDTFVNDISFLHDPRPCRRTVRVGNNDVIYSTHIGSVHIQLDNISSPIILPNVLVVPLLGRTQPYLRRQPHSCRLLHHFPPSYQLHDYDKDWGCRQGSSSRWTACPAGSPTRFQ
jgi:hypothetical protein